MKLTTRIFGGVILTAAIAGTSFAASHIDKATAGAIKARQSHMELYQHNAGVLFGMAGGKIDYDAEAASAHAADLAALSTLNQRGYWLPGSDMETLGDSTRALAAIWADGSNVGEIAGQLAEAAATMNEVAGDGLEAVQGAIGAVGAACTACHKAFRGS